MHKKNHLLIIFSLIIVLAIPLVCYAYQTVLIEFPEYSTWNMVYNQRQGQEKIIQFVPAGQTSRNWTETYIIHSYRHSKGFVMDMRMFLGNIIRHLEAKNKTKPYRYLKSTPENSIVTRCINSNEKMKAQCDIYRATRGQEAIITIQYINKDIQDFMYKYEKNLDVIERANPYYSHFRYDRVMSKGTSFEL